MSDSKKRLTITEHDRVIETSASAFPARLARPASARSLIILAHDAMTHRYSPCNRYLACGFQAAGFATLSADLVSCEEERQAAYSQWSHLNVSRLTDRLDSLAEWACCDAATRDLAIGYFGMGLGATVALLAGLQRPESIAVIVCHNGVIELTPNTVDQLTPPVLLIVEAHNRRLMWANERVAQGLKTQHRFVTIPEASPLLSKAGAFDIVIRHARSWFARHMHFSAIPDGPGVRFRIGE